MTTTTQEVKALKKEISSLKNMLADQIEETASNGHSRTSFTREDIAELANNAGKSARRFFRTKQKQLGQARDNAESVIQEHPFTTTAAAFATGMLLTSLIRKAR